MGDVGDVGDAIFKKPLRVVTLGILLEIDVTSVTRVTFLE